MKWLFQAGCTDNFKLHIVWETWGGGGELLQKSSIQQSPNNNLYLLNAWPDEGAVLFDPLKCKQVNLHVIVTT